MEGGCIMQMIVCRGYNTESRRYCNSLDQGIVVRIVLCVCVFYWVCFEGVKF